MMKTIDEKLLVLSSIAMQFNKAGITWAVGASALLYLNGMVKEFSDIDIMITDEDALCAKSILLTMGTLHCSEKCDNYRTKHFFEFSIYDIEVDVIGGFAIVKNGIEYDCSLNKAEITSSTIVGGQVIPLHSVQAWRKYYELMGRSGKVAIIDSFMGNST